MRKGYRPKTSREKFPLTVEAQRKLLEAADPRERSLIILMISTGMHPRVLALKSYNLMWSSDYYSWNRPKKRTQNKVQGAWSRAMREGDTLGHLSKLRGRTPQRLWQIVKAVGDRCRIKGVCPNQLRHTHFVNRARLGHNAFDIAHGAATDLKTVYSYYTIGMGESKTLTQEDREWLGWLMEC